MYNKDTAAWARKKRIRLQTEVVGSFVYFEFVVSFVFVGLVFFQEPGNISP